MSERRLGDSQNTYVTELAETRPGSAARAQGLHSNLIIIKVAYTIFAHTRMFTELRSTLAADVVFRLGVRYPLFPFAAITLTCIFAYTFLQVPPHVKLLFAETDTALNT